MYYNSNGNLGMLAGQASQLNAVVDLQDRNTELSYQLMLDSISDRSRYFSMWNQAIDSYDQDVRIIESHGVEDEMLFSRALNLLSHGKYSIYQPVEMNEDNKELFNRILTAFLEKYEFQLPEIFA